MKILKNFIGMQFLRAEKSFFKIKNSIIHNIRDFFSKYRKIIYLLLIGFST